MKLQISTLFYFPALYTLNNRQLCQSSVFKLHMVRFSSFVQEVKAEVQLKSAVTSHRMRFVAFSSPPLLIVLSLPALSQQRH